MSLTPRDVHNAVFSRPRVGERGYREDEVDRLLEFVEDELVRHIDEKEQLRNRLAALREQDAALGDLDDDFDQREAELSEWDAELRHQDDELRRYEAVLQRREAELREHEATLQRRQAALSQQERRIRQSGTIMRARVEQQRAAVSREQRITAVRTVAGAYGQQDTEWTAIRTVAEHGVNGVTETVQQQWTRTTESEPDESGGLTAIESAQMRQLERENAELSRANEILKAAAAQLAAEVKGGGLTVQRLTGS